MGYQEVQPARRVPMFFDGMRATAASLSSAVVLELLFTTVFATFFLVNLLVISCLSSSLCVGRVGADAMRADDRDGCRGSSLRFFVGGGLLIALLRGRC